MNFHDYPILEHDPALEAFIEPGNVIKPIDIAAHCVMCFFHDVVAKVAHEHNARIVAHVVSEMGRHPVYEIDVDGRRLAFLQPGVGAPLAAGFLEEMIAFGSRSFIACGGAGALAREITLGHLVVPVSAVRDEGTSYHYAPPSREIEPHASAVDAIEAALKRDGVPYVTGKTWTTDALYRETRTRIARRRDEGCLTVEMEAAAFFAVARFRNVPFGQILYGGDDLSSDTWDSRHWTHQSSLREKLFWLAAEACLGMT
jgi:uridine phosphorylase